MSPSAPSCTGTWGRSMEGASSRRPGKTWRPLESYEGGIGVDSVGRREPKGRSTEGRGRSPAPGPLHRCFPIKVSQLNLCLGQAHLSAGVWRTPAGFPVEFAISQATLLGQAALNTGPGVGVQKPRVCKRVHSLALWVMWPLRTREAGSYLLLWSRVTLGRLPAAAPAVLLCSNHWCSCLPGRPR